MECCLDITCNAALYRILESLKDELKFVFVVSECNLKGGTESDNYDFSHDNYKLSIRITKSSSEKCERCWHLNESVGKIDKAPTICQRCFDNVHGDGECRTYA